ncbi:hypothetical protein DVH24_042450 [Malus domestica]|uniref:Uncharacterized protein n=1 Tax=Malus domestica TaxID=3750 RepID=A0A498IY58_MALDO|nr:hypothetical protein DVH24_042450 [Malus domestica]
MFKWTCGSMRIALIPDEGISLQRDLFLKRKEKIAFLMDVSVAKQYCTHGGKYRLVRGTRCSVPHLVRLKRVERAIPQNEFWVNFCSASPTGTTRFTSMEHKIITSPYPSSSSLFPSEGIFTPFPVPKVVLENELGAGLGFGEFYGFGYFEEESWCGVVLTGGLGEEIRSGYSAEKVEAQVSLRFE